MRFLVVIPTHRLHLAAETIEQVRQSLTYPTDFHILDGKPSKVHAINKALHELLDPAVHDIYVTVDDDLILPDNWQHFIACAFDRIKNLGICGIDMEGDEYGEGIMAGAMRATRRKVRDILFRDTIGYMSVAGAVMAMPSKVAKHVGPYPFADDGRQYHQDEDGWRCHQVAASGMRYGYVTAPSGPIGFVHYQDSLEYLQQKQTDIAIWNSRPIWR